MKSKLPIVPHNGFTLVELLIVVFVMATLAGVGATILNPTTIKRRSEDAVRYSNMHLLVEGIESYRQIQEVYPIDSDGDGDPSNDAVNTDFFKFIGKWPDGNPTLTTVYAYHYNNTTQQFGLLTTKSDGRVLKYRSDISWGKRIKECASSAVITDSLCP